MRALIPTPLFQSSGWPLANPINHQNNYLITERSFESFTNFEPLQQPQIHQLDRSSSFTTNSGGDPTVIKKLYHNASERVRRTKINTFYSSLRSLLPAADQIKKLSIPGTVSRAIKYIPELQQHVESLIQKKEELLSRISSSSQGDLIHQEKPRKSLVESCLFSISASRLSDSEVLIQISTYKFHTYSLSEILLQLEEDGLLLMDACSLESSEERVFYNLHLQVERTCKMECEVLSKKLLSYFTSRKENYSHEK